MCTQSFPHIEAYSCPLPVQWSKKFQRPWFKIAPRTPAVNWRSFKSRMVGKSPRESNAVLTFGLQHPVQLTFFWTGIWCHQDKLFLQCLFTLSIIRLCRSQTLPLWFGVFLFSLLLFFKSCFMAIFKSHLSAASQQKRACSHWSCF